MIQCSCAVEGKSCRLESDEPQYFDYYQLITLNTEFKRVRNHVVKLSTSRVVTDDLSSI